MTMGKQRSWGPTGSSFFNGDRGTLTADIGDGYEAEITLQGNEDGRLVCSRLTIEYTASKLAPAIPISSRFLQKLGLGEMLSEAKEIYIDVAKFVNEVTDEQEKIILKEVRDWTLTGAAGFEDTKYASVAYLYAEQIMLGNNQPIAYLGDLMKCDRETASSRVVEARKRGLLTKPKHGNVGGVLTKAGLKALGME
jgi:hypothetical protein